MGELKVGRKNSAVITPKTKVVSYSCEGARRDCIVQTARGRKCYFCVHENVFLQFGWGKMGCRTFF